MRILMTVVGRSDKYSKTEYTFRDDSVKHWYSSYALFKILQRRGISIDKIIVLHPDTPEGRQSYEKGFDDEHIAVKDLFSNEIVVEGQALSDINSEADAWKVIESLYDLLKKELSASDTDLNIIFDITHSFRHFTILVFLFAEFLNRLSFAVALSDDNTKHINIEDIYYAKFMGERSYFITLKPISILISRVSDAYNIVHRLDYLAVDKLIEDVRSMVFSGISSREEKGRQWSKIKTFLNDTKYVLFMLSSGAVWVENVFSKIDKLSKSQITIDVDPTAAIILDAIGSELSKIAIYLNDEKVWRKQIKLAILIMDRRGDVGTSLALAAEGFLSWIIEEIEHKDPTDSKVRQIAGHVGLFRRYLESTKAFKHDAVIADVYNILSKLLEKRNAFAHVFTDRDLLSKVSHRDLRDILKDLDRFLDVLSDPKLVTLFKPIWTAYKNRKAQ